jgi:hypothetical protein
MRAGQQQVPVLLHEVRPIPPHRLNQDLRHGDRRGDPTVRTVRQALAQQWPDERPVRGMRFKEVDEWRRIQADQRTGWQVVQQRHRSHSSRRSLTYAWASMSPQVSFPRPHTLMLFPSIPLRSAGRYGRVFTRGVRMSATRWFGPSTFEQAVLAPTSAGEPAAMTAARTLAEEVLRDVATYSVLPVPADDVTLALRISTRSTTDLPAELLAIRAQLSAQPLQPSRNSCGRTGARWSSLPATA